MRRKVMIVIILIFVSTQLSACFDAVEIENYAYVTMLGIERGVSDKLRLTFQIPKFNTSGASNGGSEGGGGEEGTLKENITIEAASLLSGVTIINSSIPLILNFMHLKAVVVSEELATSGYLGNYVAPLLRYRQLRRTTSLIVCKGTAEEFLKATKPYLGIMVTKSLDELFQKSESTGVFPNLSLGDMYNNMKTQYTNLLGMYGAVNKGENLETEGAEYKGKFKSPADYYAGDVPRQGGQDIELLGSTVSVGDKMVGKLTGFETQMVQLVRGELKRASFTMSDPKEPDYVIPIEVKEFEKVKTTIDLSGEKPKINTKIGLEGDMTVVQSEINYESPEKKKEIESAFEQYLKNGIERTFAKCKALQADVFEFGAVAVKQFWTIPEWESYNWLNKFQDAELTIEVDFTMRRTGRMVKTMPVVSPEASK